METLLKKDRSVILTKKLFKMMVFLLCFVALIQPDKYLGYYLSFPFKYLFGIFYIVDLSIIAIFSLFQVIFLKEFKVRTKVCFGLSFAILFASHILFSDGLDINSYTDLFNCVKDLPISFISQISSLKGGFLGNLFSSLVINSTDNGLLINKLIFGGLSLVLLIIIFLISFNKKAIKKVKKEKKDKSFNFAFNKIKDQEEIAMINVKDVESDDTPTNSKILDMKDYDVFDGLPFARNEEVVDLEFDIFTDDCFKTAQVRKETEVKDISDEFLFGHLPSVPKKEEIQETTEDFDTFTSNGFIKEEQNQVEETSINEGQNYDLFEEEIQDLPENPIPNPEIRHELFVDNLRYNDDVELTPINTNRFNLNYDNDELPDIKKDFNSSGDYVYPDPSILSSPQTTDISSMQYEAQGKAQTLNAKLKSLGVKGRVKSFVIAPAFTRFEIEVDESYKISSFPSLKQDIMMALEAPAISIYAPIPGTGYCGVDIPNKVRQLVTFKECLLANSINFRENLLDVNLGKDISGEVQKISITKAPHILVAGETGSGKSMCLNSIICSILMKARPDEVKMVMVDPKMLELSIYNDIPHLLCPVIIDPRKASVALSKLVEEMKRRFKLFADAGGKKSLASYNELAKLQGKEVLPYIVVVIDELANLMMVARNEVEDYIIQLTSLARAAGIHLIVATQKPIATVITSLIKTNVPAKIAFSVGSNSDSRVILDDGGAENLLGSGDMLVKLADKVTLMRLQGCFLDEQEITNIVEAVKKNGKPEYSNEFLSLEPTQTMFGGTNAINYASLSDEELYKFVLQYLRQVDDVSASLIERKFRLGWQRAGRIFDQLQMDGYLGERLGGNKGCEVLKDRLPK